MTALALATIAGCTSLREDEPVTARAFLVPRAGSRMSGLARFEPTAQGLRVVVEVFDAPPGEHGVHLHDVSGCAAIDASGVGHHFNPSRTRHGAPTSAESHAGDFGNILVGPSGIGRLELVTPRLSTRTSADSVLGYTICITQAPDDFVSQPYGASGPILACGEIRKE